MLILQAAGEDNISRSGTQILQNVTVTLTWFVLGLFLGREREPAQSQRCSQCGYHPAISATSGNLSEENTAVDDVSVC